RQSAAQQAKVFARHRRRHIVLATNVAETSLTVPGIRYVIDPGTARISRYSARSKVQRLPIEKVSRASADQRKGRCGRVAAGVCIRLYSEEDYLSRPEFTDPEIRRTHLASVILQLESLGLGHIDDFPFIDPPDPRQVSDGYRLLEELGAMDRDRRITDLGRRLAKLPVDPRLARMLLAGAESGCLSEVLVIASALSIQDPRERPLDRTAAADAAHARFADPRSDFLSLLNLWRFYEEQLRHLSRNQMRKLCRTSFLSHNRMREWRDIHAQLRGMLHDMGLATNEEEAGYEPIHRALLSGLVGQIGMLDEQGEYLGPRGMKFRIFPGSTVAAKPPKWIMAAELAETSRLYARMVAAIEPQWVLAAAPAHLLRRQWFDPHWSKRRGRVQACERVSLYGLVLEPRRRVDFAAIDRAETRRIFIEAALVRGELARLPRFLRRNQALIAELQELEHRSRRPDILVDEAALAAFYDERLPPEVHSADSLEKWLKQAGREADRLLLTRDDLLRGEAGVRDRDYPPELQAGALRLPLSYRFAPGEEEDGVSVTVPLAALNQLDPEPLEWLVPGLLEEKVTALIRTLPRPKRAPLAPAPDTAAAFCREAVPGAVALTRTLGDWIARHRGVRIATSDWRADRLPDHLRMNIRVMDDQGRLLAQGRELKALQAKLGERAQASFRHTAAWRLEREGITDWDFGPLPERVTGRSGGAELTGYPALVDEEQSVALRVVDTQAEARHLTHAGVRRLFMLVLAKRFAWLRRNLPGFERLALCYRELGDREELRSEILAAVAERAFMEGFESIRDEAAFRARLEQGRGELVAIANGLCALLLRILEPYRELHGRLNGALPPAWLAAAGDLQEQLWHLVYAGFVSATPPDRLKELPRYLEGMRVRLEKLPRNPARDAARQRELEPHWRRYAERIEALEAQGWLLTDEPELEKYRWMLEEYRVQLFAQELGTKIPVSPKKLEQQWARVTAAA
ncbi:MAG: ATP-dependent RNA helicase HrpA, partial [Gammaproteobacteria bacterium]